MNAKYEQSAEKKAIVDALLAIDSRMPTSSAEGREVAKAVLRRDRRRGPNPYVDDDGLVPVNGHRDLRIHLLVLHKRRARNGKGTGETSPRAGRNSKSWNRNSPSPFLRHPWPIPHWSLRIEGHILYIILLVTVGGIIALFAPDAGGRRLYGSAHHGQHSLTLRQIQAEPVGPFGTVSQTLQQSLRASHSPGTSQMPQEPGG